MGTDKKKTKITNSEDYDKPHPINKKQEKEYREQKGKSPIADDADDRD